MLVPLLFFAQVTYSQDIAPILNRNCVSCHQDGEAAPFPLTTYQEVKRHATQIAQVTQSRYMPPWLPKQGSETFRDAKRLTPAEISTLAAWAKNNSPEGPPLNPIPSHAREKWPLGPPDLILQFPDSFTLPASGEDIFRNFVLPAPPDRTHYIRAIDIHPGNRKLVHHANIVIDRARTLRAQDAKDGQPGFPGMDVSTESGNTFDPDSHFLFYKPGSPPEFEPEGMSWRLDPENDLILNLHLRPSGKPEQIRPEVGLYFAKDAATRFPMLLQLEHDGALDIPPGATAFTVTDRLTLPVACDLLRIYPHAHYLGKQMEAWAKLPDGTRRPLIDIADWNLDWQAVFSYAQPIHLPKGTTIEMRIRYDNSAANPRNPAAPPVRVKAGNRARDEMGHVWLQVLPTGPATPDPRLALQQAAMSRRLEKYPSDFLARYNLGALFETEEHHEDAVKQFEAAVTLEPGNAVARNALAASLLSSGKNADALREWRETVRRNPDYSPAHFNLARLLAALDDAPGAISQYRIYLQQHPEDAEAHLGLGAVYIAARQYAEAIPEYAKACDLDPANADAQANLGTLLARTGNLPEAIVRFEKALELDPANAAARANLNRARAH